MTGGRPTTRRRYLRGAAGVAAAGVFAGCTGGSDPTDDGTNANEGIDTGDDPDGESGDDGDAWTATLAPAGEVTFDAVPENVMVYNLLYADLTVAYGHGDAVNSLGFDVDVDGRTLDAYYERLDGVGPDWDDLTQLNSGSGSVSIDKELFYELDSDLHLVDPALVTGFEGWDRTDVEEVGTHVAPWFGNSLSREHAEPPAAWTDDYEYYTLWEIAERVASVFRERERYEALAAVHEDLLARIEADLPPEEERPTVAVAIFMEDTFYPTRSDGPGFATAHVRPFGAPDAFVDAGMSVDSAVDYEGMAEADPDVILHPFGLASYYSVPEIRETLADHPVANEVTAVDTGRVYPSGNPVQGPVMNLFQTEMTAKQLFPDRFGEWPAYDGGAYPEFPADEQLFDRERVAAILRGDV